VQHNLFYHSWSPILSTFSFLIHRLHSHQGGHQEVVVWQERRREGDEVFLWKRKR
jgi:hypothetical protein